MLLQLFCSSFPAHPKEISCLHAHYRICREACRGKFPQNRLIAHSTHASRRVHGAYREHGSPSTGLNVPSRTTAAPPASKSPSRSAVGKGAVAFAGLKQGGQQIQDARAMFSGTLDLLVKSASLQTSMRWSARTSSTHALSMMIQIQIDIKCYS